MFECPKPKVCIQIPKLFKLLIYSAKYNYNKFKILLFDLYINGKNVRKKKVKVKEISSIDVVPVAPQRNEFEIDITKNSTKKCETILNDSTTVTLQGVVMNDKEEQDKEDMLLCSELQSVSGAHISSVPEEEKILSDSNEEAEAKILSNGKILLNSNFIVEDSQNVEFNKVQDIIYPNFCDYSTLAETVKTLKIELQNPSSPVGKYLLIISTQILYLL